MIRPYLKPQLKYLHWASLWKWQFLKLNLIALRVSLNVSSVKCRTNLLNEVYNVTMTTIHSKVSRNSDMMVWTMYEA